MTGSDDILAQIDSALGDWSVGPDAMRVQPAAEPFHFGGATPLLYIADEVDGWQQVEGVASVEFCVDVSEVFEEAAEAWAQITERIRQAEHERVRRERAALEAFVQAVRSMLAPAVERAASSMSDATEAFRHLPEAEGCNDCKPALRRDRPAWQTPYGPARRRRS